MLECFLVLPWLISGWQQSVMCSTTAVHVVYSVHIHVHYQNVVLRLMRNVSNIFNLCVISISETHLRTNVCIT